MPEKGKPDAKFKKNIEKMGSWLPNEVILLGTFLSQAMLDGNLNHKVTEVIRKTFLNVLFPKNNPSKLKFSDVLTVWAPNKINHETFPCWACPADRTLLHHAGTNRITP